MIATDLKINGNGNWTAAQESGSQSLMVWESEDLVNWSEQRMVPVSADIEAGCTWAPEATYDEKTGEYVVYWASKVSADRYGKQRLYYAKTRDFYSFTEPKVYIDYDESSIDTTMTKVGDTYYRFTKNEGGNTNELGAKTKTVFLEKGKDVLGEFSQVTSDSLNSNQYVEGPTIFKLNQDDSERDTWCLLVDDFGGRGYYPLISTDLSTGVFSTPEAEAYKMPSRARHGTPIRITSAEYEKVLAAYGTPERVESVAEQGKAPQLPDTVKLGRENKNVTWNVNDSMFDVDVFSYVEVTGTVEGSEAEAVATVQVLPANMEYMIDCANTGSKTWKNAKKLSKNLKNQEITEQAKTDSNSWGRVSVIGTDVEVYSGSSATDPYVGGYWAKGGKNISYDVTLPAGDHTIMLGCQGWWSMNRSMKVYYQLNHGEEIKLCDFEARSSRAAHTKANLSLDEEAVVTITIKKAANDDPILSWLAVCGTEKVIEHYDSISGTNAAPIYDNKGNKIQAHGGQIQKLTVNGKTKWYWIGEDRTNGYRPMPGVHMYSSDDLYNWKDEGVVLRTMQNMNQFQTDDYFKSLYGNLSESEQREVYVDLWAEGCVMERPKMLYNEKTKKYVLWFHADGTSPFAQDNGSNYAKAKAGIAVADNPAGPYKLVGSYLLATKDGQNHGFDSEGGHVRDMNLFKDDDGQAYVMYSSEGNAVMYIAKLNEDYTNIAKPADEMVYGEDFAISSTDSREAPAMFKYEDKYYLITSGCTGWAANQARYAVADSPLGPWTNMGDPCIGDKSHTTFDTQSTCVIPVDEAKGAFIYMGDRWYNPDNGKDLSDSRYVWLPIEFGTDNTIAIREAKDWTLADLENKGSLDIKTKLPEKVYSAATVLSQMPTTLDLTIGGKSYKAQKVTWSVAKDVTALGDNAMGYVTVTGKLEALNRSFTKQVLCVPKNLTYFVDCGGDSKIFATYKKQAESLQNQVADQAFNEEDENPWGYTSILGAEDGDSAEDMGQRDGDGFFDSGYWATGKGKISYRFSLKPGTYQIVTGA